MGGSEPSQTAVILGKSQKTDRKLLVLQKRRVPWLPITIPPILVRLCWDKAFAFIQHTQGECWYSNAPSQRPGAGGRGCYLQSCRIRRQFEHEITPWGLLSVGRGWDLTFLGIDILAPRWLYDLQAASGSIPSARCVLTANCPVYMRLVISHRLRK